MCKLPKILKINETKQKNIKPRFNYTKKKEKIATRIAKVNTPTPTKQKFYFC